MAVRVHIFNIVLCQLQGAADRQQLALLAYSSNDLLLRNMNMKGGCISRTAIAPNLTHHLK